LAELAGDPDSLRAEFAKAMKAKRFDDAEAIVKVLREHPDAAEYAESASRRLELARQRATS
jgi:hypothetical protein